MNCEGQRAVFVLTVLYLTEIQKSKAKTCNGRRHVPLCPASANEK